MISRLQRAGLHPVHGLLDTIRLRGAGVKPIVSRVNDRPNDEVAASLFEPKPNTVVLDFKPIWITLLLVACLGIGVRAQQIPQAEFDALVALYNATDGPNWTNNNGWNTTTNDVDGGGWYGVTVENGHVTELFLSQNGLAGTLPAVLGDLSELSDLWISRNDELTGPIPAELSNLSQLDTLYLSDNLLTGTIPAQLGDLSNLSVMYLNNNALTGAIPSELGNLSSMTDLNLATNQLAGTLPSELGDLSNLVYLSLHSNDFTGSIPPQLGNLSQLDWLRLWGNELTDTIPIALANLSNLSWLELMDNQFSGTIPQAIIDMANGGNRTTRIYLQDNNFTGIGTLPSTFFADFEIYNNQLDFADLAGNIGNLAASDYSPQRFAQDPVSVVLSMGDAFDLIVNPGGQNLTYLWQKNYTVLGMDTPRVSVSSASLGDAGIYFCTVTSPALPELRIISDEVSITVDGLTSECGEDEGLPLGLIWRGAVISAQTNGSPDFQGVVNDSVTIIPIDQPNRYTISAHVAGAFGFDAPGDFYADCQGGAHLYETFSLGTVNDGSDFGGAFSSYDSATHTLRLSSRTFSAFPAFTTFAVTEFTPYVAPPTLSNRSVELDTASGATVGTLSTFIDPNSDSTQYTLVSGVGDADNALFQIVGAELRLVSSYSPAAPETLSVRVRAIHDDRPYAMDSVFAIAVTEGTVSALTDGPSESLSLFPNPVGELLYVRFHGASGEAVECTIHDMSGRRMLTRTFTTSPGSTTHPLDLTALPHGLYLLKIDTDAGTVMKKIIKS